MIQAPGITVNGVKITIEEINSEVQYHPSASLSEAKYEAMQALVIRELLLQQAVGAGLGLPQGKEAVDDIIGRLLEQEIKVPEPTAEECMRYYDNNASKFVTTPLYEVSHILYLAPPEDEKARNSALLKAKQSLRKIHADPSYFQELAKAESACPSGKIGGSLGQIGKGQTLPAFEAALFRMKEGDVSAEPLATEVGFHLIKVHKRVDGQVLPFEAVSEWIGDHLSQQSWQRAFSQYIQVLAAQAKISGFALKRADSPLVQ
jgi:peptidyl-prolyl cis-trans isomerase C